jgi:hypothetical protein
VSRRRWWLLGCAACACGGDETLLAPLDAGMLEAGPDAASDSPPPPEDAGPEVDAAAPAPKRTLLQRNPFGNVAEADNLLWDGDFEWHTFFASQYGWASTQNLIVQGAFDQIEIGPACRSGMKCGTLTQSQRFAAIGVAPSGAKVMARVFGKPPTGDCYDLAVELFACDYALDPDLALEDADGPDADGWCEYSGVGEERQRATCLSVEARFVEGKALVDDAVVKAAPPGARLARPAPLASPDRRAALEQSRAALRAWLKPGSKPPHPAREAWIAWRRSRPR